MLLQQLLTTHSSCSGCDTSDETTDMPGLNTVPVGGILAFNMTGGKWTISSIPSELARPLGKNGFSGSMPSFGPVGLLLAAGAGTVNDASRTFDKITIYEPSNKT